MSKVLVMVLYGRSADVCMMSVLRDQSGGLLGRLLLLCMQEWCTITLIVLFLSEFHASVLT